MKVKNKQKNEKIYQPLFLLSETTKKKSIHVQLGNEMLIIAMIIFFAAFDLCIVYFIVCMYVGDWGVDIGYV